MIDDHLTLFLIFLGSAYVGSQVQRAINALVRIAKALEEANDRR